MVRDGVQTTYVDGRKLHRQPLELDHPPWLAVRAPRQLAAANRLQIVGSPRIPEEVRLSAPSNLSAWKSYFEDPSLSSNGPRWQRVGGARDPGEADIIGTYRGDLAGSFAETC